MAERIVNGANLNAPAANMLKYGLPTMHSQTPSVAFEGIDRLLLLISLSDIAARTAQHDNVIEAAKAAGVAVGAGALFALAPGKGILAHRKANDMLHAYIALNKPEHWLGELARDGDVRPLVLAEFADWAPGLTALITDGDTPLILRAIHALPVDHRWERTPGVTLLGDAAHLMSPFAGEGANLAMFDGAELGKVIVDNPDEIEVALRTYETDLFPRSLPAAEEAARNLKLLFDERAPLSLLDLFTSR